ncbi:MAG: hypothetical protein FJZ97_01530 [Chloroflexi bacterium]|nr:hypothetical protein [Chloroflexota bacterium]
MLHRLRESLLGSPLPTYALGDRRLNRIQALAAFSLDGLSSIAYANQEIFLGLVVAGSAGTGKGGSRPSCSSSWRPSTGR